MMMSTTHLQENGQPSTDNCSPLRQLWKSHTPRGTNYRPSPLTRRAACNPPGLSADGSYPVRAKNHPPNHQNHFCSHSNRDKSPLDHQIFSKYRQVQNPRECSLYNGQETGLARLGQWWIRPFLCCSAGRVRDSFYSPLQNSNITTINDMTITTETRDKLSSSGGVLLFQGT